MSAGAMLQAALIERLAEVPELSGVYDGPPLQAVVPYAVVETGPETDWGHKSGGGRELRVAVVLRDEGEPPVRLTMLMDEIEAAALGIGADLDGWRLVNLQLVRRLASKERDGRRAGLVELRARMLAA